MAQVKQCDNCGAIKTEKGRWRQVTISLQEGPAIRQLHYNYDSKAIDACCKDCLEKALITKVKEFIK